MEISPDILQAAAADPASEAWSFIWAKSCHQGNCDPASAVLVPWLSTTIAAFTGEACVKALALAGYIVVDSLEADRTSYRGEIAALRGMAAQRLANASDDREFVYLQQAILGFDGDELWGKELDHLNDGEVDVECPGCDAEVLVDLGDDESSVIPGLSSEVAERLHAEAVEGGRAVLATALTRLFGRIECPECGSLFNVAEHLAGVSRG
ncbi:hypothetical protein Aab01nite_33640 [Paractinoplanes abujensis]|uniref:Uncharacterized protein n=1 Tax=Paractinoplanes abujensis TaxID=882441 RepID=A0A7W7CZV1_9ACTN|nr:hypothetical protein [Actinoplanes abujensis]MBB4697739.1 hypothetical protein [Actinoplanes abujensis]GID19774.1 hypothetical protein Aab01nite_33640 [Actinoplanes abujensis]